MKNRKLAIAAGAAFAALVIYQASNWLVFRVLYQVLSATAPHSIVLAPMLPVQ